eukprot:Skav210463  [mRNA]  locus=scaffold1443:68392:72968:- [translate_table: standard]
MVAVCSPVAQVAAQAERAQRLWRELRPQALIGDETAEAFLANGVPTRLHHAQHMQSLYAAGVSSKSLASRKALVPSTRSFPALILACRDRQQGADDIRRLTTRTGSHADGNIGVISSDGSMLATGISTTKCGRPGIFLRPWRPAFCAIASNVDTFCNALQNLSDKWRRMNVEAQLPPTETSKIFSKMCPAEAIEQIMQAFVPTLGHNFGDLCEERRHVARAGGLGKEKKSMRGEERRGEVRRGGGLVKKKKSSADRRGEQRGEEKILQEKKGGEMRGEEMRGEERRGEEKKSMRGGESGEGRGGGMWREQGTGEGEEEYERERRGDARRRKEGR